MKIVICSLMVLLGSHHSFASSWIIRTADQSFQKPALCEEGRQQNNRKRHGYHICADQVKLVEQAMARAKQEKKLLIIKFGADWCPWCLKLHRLMPSDKVLGYSKDDFGYDSKFHLVEIATSTVSKGQGVVPVKSGQLVSDTVLSQMSIAKSRVRGIPYLAILDPENPGKGMFQRSKYLESRLFGLFYHYKGVSYEPENIRALLKKTWYRLRG